ncbi:MAG TPA: DnaB-like helicase N-terminal domain-containing protein, partial [Gemmatimonadaceae bacterium]
MKEPLSDVPTECAVLSCMLDDARAVTEAAAILQPDDFTSPANALIFAALVSLGVRDVEPDPIALADALAARGELEAAGGKVAIGELIDYVPSSVNVEHYAHIIRELGDRRRLIALADTLRRSAADRAVDLSDTTSTTIEALLPLSDSGRVEEGFQRANYWPVMEEMERRSQSEGVPGLPTGFPELDDKVHGFQPGWLVVIGGVAKGGKTALALAMARHNMVEQGAAVGFVSAEMSRNDLLERLLNAESGV